MMQATKSQEELIDQMVETSVSRAVFGDEVQRREFIKLVGGGGAVALLASGQSSTITGTLAGQIVMEGFLKIRIRPWLRRLITRLLAIVPAIFLIGVSGGKNTVGLLVFSQVVLSMQLSFAIFPLMSFTSDKKMMGEFANSRGVMIVGYAMCTLIASLNLYLLYQALGWGWMALIVALASAFAIWVLFFYRGD